MSCLCTSLSCCSIEETPVVPIKYAVKKNNREEFSTKVHELEEEIQSSPQAHVVAAVVHRSLEQLLIVSEIKKILTVRIKTMDTQVASDINALSESVLRYLLLDKDLQKMLQRQTKKAILLVRLFRSVTSFNKVKNNEHKRTQWFLNHRVRVIRILHECAKNNFFISMKELLALVARYDPSFGMLYADNMHMLSQTAMLARIDYVYNLVQEVFKGVSLIKITLPQALQVLYSNLVVEDSFVVHLALCMGKSEDSSSVYCARAFFSVEQFVKPRYKILLEVIEKYIYASVEAKIQSGTAQLEDVRRLIALRITKGKTNDVVALFKKSRAKSISAFSSYLQSQYPNARLWTFQNLRTCFYALLKTYDYRFVENEMMRFPASGITADNLLRLKNRYIEETQGRQLLALIKKSKNEEILSIYKTYDLLQENWKYIEGISRLGEVLDVAICIHDIFQRYKNASKDTFIVLSRTRRGGGIEEGACRRIHCIPATKEVAVVSDAMHSLQKGAGASKIMRIALHIKKDEFIQTIAYCWTKLYERGEDSEREIQHQKLLQGKGVLTLLKSFHGAVSSFRLVPQLEHIWWTTLAHGSLNDVAKKKLSVTDAQILQISLDILKAIAHIHSKGVIHGDLKDGNVLYTQDSNRAITILLADFGLTAPVVIGETIKGWCGYYNKGLYGSVYLTDPQLLRGDNTDGPFVGNHFKIELFAVGIMLYQLLNNGAYPKWITLLRNFHKDGMQSSQRVFIGKAVQREVTTFCDQYKVLQIKFEGKSLSTLEKVQYVMCRLLDQNLTTRPTAEEAVKLLA